MPTSLDPIYTPKELTEQQKKFITDLVPILEQSGELLTSKFYQTMLSSYPEVRPFFNKTNQATLTQPRILAFALLNYAKNINDLTPLVAFVNQIVVKHVGLQVRAEHYPIVGLCLLATMKELLGDLATPEFLEAWATAYGNLAHLLIEAEANAYAKNQWQGFRPFTVKDIVDECDDVKSVYLRPVEGKIQVPKPGQYICIRFPIDAEQESREYSLSEFPHDNQYRISVRNIGKVSSYIHTQLKVGDELEVAPPAGQFVYQAGTNDVVLFVGGIGITPCISIIEEALTNGRNVSLFYSNKMVATRAFGPYLTKLKQRFNRLTIHEFFSDSNEKLGIVERATLARIGEHDISRVDWSRKPDVYVLGPPDYMKFIHQAVDGKAAAVYSEFFGPTRP